MSVNFDVFPRQSRANHVAWPGLVSFSRISQIDSALLAIALDDHDTPDLEAECRAFLTGDNGRNRWFDKHQLVRMYGAFSAIYCLLRR